MVFCFNLNKRPLVGIHYFNKFYYYSINNITVEDLYSDRIKYSLIISSDKSWISGSYSQTPNLIYIENVNLIGFDLFSKDCMT